MKLECLFNWELLKILFSRFYVGDTQNGGKNYILCVLSHAAHKMALLKYHLYPKRITSCHRTAGRLGWCDTVTDFMDGSFRTLTFVEWKSAPRSWNISEFWTHGISARLVIMIINDVAVSFFFHCYSVFFSCR